MGETGSFLDLENLAGKVRENNKEGDTEIGDRELCQSEIPARSGSAEAAEAVGTVV